MILGELSLISEGWLKPLFTQMMKNGAELPGIFYPIFYLLPMLLAGIFFFLMQYKMQFESIESKNGFKTCHAYPETVFIFLVTFQMKYHEGKCARTKQFPVLILDLDL